MIFFKNINNENNTKINPINISQTNLYFNNKVIIIVLEKITAIRKYQRKSIIPATKIIDILVINPFYIWSQKPPLRWEMIHGENCHELG